MCGRYGFIPNKDVAERYGLAESIHWDASYNIAPGTINPVVTLEDDVKKIRLMKWGLVPSWWKKDPTRVGFSNINARIEDIENKPVYRGPFKNKRCLVPASFFFEWALTPDPKVKEPFVFRLKDRDFFSLAGVFDVWKDVEGEELYTYSIVTTQPNDLVGQVHARMPVILKKEDEDEWADNSRFDPAMLKEISRPYAQNAMDAWQVDRKVGNSRLDGPELIKPVET